MSTQTRFLLQLAGAPGVGKSTLARGIGRMTGATVVDRDVIKSALLENGVVVDDAGRLSFDVMFALAGDVLRASDRGVILDTTSHYPTVPRRASALALRARVPFLFMECVLEDLAELERRLVSRPRRASQMGVFDQTPRGSSAEKVGVHRWRTYGPSEGWPVLKMNSSPSGCVEEARRVLEI